jgi:hypothetical protein
VYDVDFSVLPAMKLGFGYGKVADRAITRIAQQCFQEANLKRLTQIENAKVIGWNPSSRIAESARRFTESKWSGIAVRVNTAKLLASRYRYGFKFDPSAFPSFCEIKESNGT